jgi:hypothetical protein
VHLATFHPTPTFRKRPRGSREGLTIRLQVRAAHQKCGLGMHLAVLRRRRIEIADRAASLAAPLPLVRVTPAVEAGDHVHSLVHDPKEQRVWKSSAPRATDVSVDNREMLWRRSNPFDDPLDFRSKASGQFRVAGAIPIARLDQFSPCSGTKDYRRHGQRRCRSSALSWSHGMPCSRS